MIKICTICARGGSQGVKNKNILPLRGKPLIAHSILQAKAANIFDAIIVSSDSDAILDTAKIWSADYLIKRPAPLATATAGKIPAIQHAVATFTTQHNISPDIIVDLDPTSPLRMVSDINQALQLFLTNPNADNLISGAPSRKSPYFNMVEEENGQVKLVKIPTNQILRRQDSPTCYDVNASIYIWHHNALFNNKNLPTSKTLLYKMPEERSIDIDTKWDLKLVRFLSRNRKDLAWNNIETALT